MSNLKLKKLISLILCGTFMNCSISCAMNKDNNWSSLDYSSDDSDDEPKQDTQKPTRTKKDDKSDIKVLNRKTNRELSLEKDKEKVRSTSNKDDAKDNESSLSDDSDDSLDELSLKKDNEKLQSTSTKKDDKSGNKFTNAEQSQIKSSIKEQTEKDGDINYDGDDESEVKYSKLPKERSREEDKKNVKSEYRKNNNKKDYTYENKLKKGFQSNSQPEQQDVRVSLTIKYSDCDGIRDSYECNLPIFSDSVSGAFVHAFNWINKNKLNRYNSTDQHKTNYPTVYVWLSNILKHLKNPASKLDRELPEVQKKLIESIKQELGDTNLIQSISVSGGKSGKFSKYKNGNPDLFLTLTCKSKFPDCKIWDGCVFPAKTSLNDFAHRANKNAYAYTLEALLERSKHTEITNNGETKSHYSDSLSDLVDLKGYASEEENLPDIPDNTSMKTWVQFHNNKWRKKEGLSSNNIVDMEKALQAIKWLRQLTSKNYENDNRIGSIYFKAIEDHVLGRDNESVNVKTPFGSIVEVVATDENEFMNTGLNSSSGLRRGVARDIMNAMPLNRLKKGMEIMKNLLDSTASSDFLKYDKNRNLIYYDYPNHFSNDINRAGFEEKERKALDKLFLNLVYFYPRRLKENGKLGRAHIERAYKILHNIK